MVRSVLLCLALTTPISTSGLTVQCPCLGKIEPAHFGTDETSSFLAASGVQTFVCHQHVAGHENNGVQEMANHGNGLRTDLVEPIHQRWGPAMQIFGVLSPDACRNIQRTCEETLGFGNFDTGKNQHGALQLLVSESMAQLIARRIQTCIDVVQVEKRRKEVAEGCSHLSGSQSPPGKLQFAGINRRWRVYRYKPNAQERFAPHIDAGFPASGIDSNGCFQFDVGDPDVVSRLTLLLYLNDDFKGGETVFYHPSSSSSSPEEAMAMVRPVTGSVLLFPQAVGEEAVEYARQNWPLHEGSIVRSGRDPKYVIRSDVLFRELKTPPT